MIKAVLFDLDGTLIDSNNLILHTFKEIFKTYLNMDISDEELLRDLGEPLRDTMTRYGGQNAESLMKAYVDYNTEIHDNMTKCFIGVPEALKELKKMGMKLAVVTSKRRIMAERGLKLFNLYELMDAIITPEDTEKHKPNAEPVLKACDLLKIEPKEAIMVGDNHNDIRSGNSAGCISCLVSYTAVPIENVLRHKPDYVIDHINEILHIINEKAAAI